MSLLFVGPEARADWFTFERFEIVRPDQDERHPRKMSFDIPVPAGSLESLFSPYLCLGTSYGNTIEGDKKMKILVEARVLVWDENGEPEVRGTVKLKGSAEEGREWWRDCKTIEVPSGEDATVRVAVTFKKPPVLDYPFGFRDIYVRVGSRQFPRSGDNRRGSPQTSVITSFSASESGRHRRKFESLVPVSRSMPEGGEVCAAYARRDAIPAGAGSARVKVKWFVLRGEDARVVERGKLRSARVLEERTPLVCRRTGSLERGDFLLVRHLFSKMPETSGWEVQAALSPWRETETWIELESVTPSLGSVILPGVGVTAQVRGVCDDPDGCRVGVSYANRYGEPMWSGGGRLFPQGGFSLRRQLPNCNNGETAGGLLLEVRRLNEVLLAERFVEGELECRF